MFFYYVLRFLGSVNKGQKEGDVHWCNRWLPSLFLTDVELKEKAVVVSMSISWAHLRGFLLIINSLFCLSWGQKKITWATQMRNGYGCLFHFCEERVISVVYAFSSMSAPHSLIRSSVTNQNGFQLFFILFKWRASPNSLVGFV